jgi:hypothetical protein
MQSIVYGFLYTKFQNKNMHDGIINELKAKKIYIEKNPQYILQETGLFIDSKNNNP